MSEFITLGFTIHVSLYTREYSVLLIFTTESNRFKSKFVQEYLSLCFSDTAGDSLLELKWNGFCVNRPTFYITEDSWNIFKGWKTFVSTEYYVDMIQYECSGYDTRTLLILLEQTN